MKRILARFFGACLVLLYIATLIAFLVDFDGIGTFLFVLIASSIFYLLPGVLLLRVGKRREQVQKVTFNQQINNSQWGSNNSKGAISSNNYFDLQTSKTEVTTDFFSIQTAKIDASNVKNLMKDLKHLDAMNAKELKELKEILDLTTVEFNFEAEMNEILGTQKEAPAATKEKVTSVQCSGCGAKVTASNIISSKCEYCGTVVQL